MHRQSNQLCKFIQPQLEISIIEQYPYCPYSYDASTEDSLRTGPGLGAYIISAITWGRNYYSDFAEEETEAKGCDLIRDIYITNGKTVFELSFSGFKRPMLFQWC